MNRIIHAKINGRAGVNLKLISDNCNVIVIIIVIVWIIGRSTKHAKLLARIFFLNFCNSTFLICLTDFDSTIRNLNHRSTSDTSLNGERVLHLKIIWLIILTDKQLPIYVDTAKTSSSHLVQPNKPTGRPMYIKGNPRQFRGLDSTPWIPDSSY